MKLFTIGFTKSKARDFFGRLNRSGVKTVLDTRLNRVSQLSGFAKQDDLAYFLEAVGGIKYKVEDLLAPTPEILSAYRKGDISWSEYEASYLELLNRRRIEQHFHDADLDNVCLLCSEATPEHCHRRLAANYLVEAREGVQIIHL